MSKRPHEWTESEREAAEALITLALRMSLHAFERLAGESTQMRPVELSFASDSGEFDTQSLPSKLYVLHTDMLGETRGESLLIFSEQHASRLGERLLGKQDAVGREALLLETANILSASAITHFAEFLGTSMLGGVPRLSHMRPGDFGRHIRSRSTELPVALVFDMRFDFGAVEHPAQFVWLFEASFADRVAALSENEGLLERLRAKSAASDSEA